jgi:hypothetical protein
LYHTFPLVFRGNHLAPTHCHELLPDVVTRDHDSLGVLLKKDLVYTSGFLVLHSRLVNVDFVELLCLIVGGLDDMAAFGALASFKLSRRRSEE